MEPNFRKIDTTQNDRNISSFGRKLQQLHNLSFNTISYGNTWGEIVILVSNVT